MYENIIISIVWFGHLRKNISDFIPRRRTFGEGLKVRVDALRLTGIRGRQRLRQKGCWQEIWGHWDGRSKDDNRGENRVKNTWQKQCKGQLTRNKMRNIDNWKYLLLKTVVFMVFQCWLHLIVEPLFLCIPQLSEAFCVRQMFRQQAGKIIVTKSFSLSDKSTNEGCVFLLYCVFLIYKNNNDI